MTTIAEWLIQQGWTAPVTVDGSISDESIQDSLQDEGWIPPTEPKDPLRNPKYRPDTDWSYSSLKPPPDRDGYRRWRIEYYSGLSYSVDGTVSRIEATVKSHRELLLRQRWRDGLLVVQLVFQDETAPVEDERWIICAMQVSGRG